MTPLERLRDIIVGAADYYREYGEDQLRAWLRENAPASVGCRSCVWQGKRKNDAEFYGPHGMVSAAEVEPCPRCGGQVTVQR